MKGVVSLQQRKFGTQCGAYGRWIGQLTSQCDDELNHNIFHNHTTRRHHQQGYVGWMAADTKSHMKTVFFLQDNITKFMTLQQWPRGQP